jgi:hypothetical protein
MKNNQRNIARKRAFYQLRDKYPKQYHKLYLGELEKLGLEPRKIAKKSVKDKDMAPEQAEKLIAERMMSTEYLGALMQESVVSNRKLDIDIEPVDVTLDPMYSPTWDENTQAKRWYDREENDGKQDAGNDDN